MPKALSPVAFPATRLRRPRAQAWSRELLAETQLNISDLIWPVFVQEGKNTATPIDSMPGVFRMTIDIAAQKAKEAHALGIKAIALFPVIDAKLKSLMGDEALFDGNLICRAIKEIKNAVPEIGLIADVALDPYTTHGQDGILEHDQIANDKTVEILCKQALTLAKAGCDIVAPSDMMDGRVGAIRAALEKGNYHDTMILAYAAKYASAMYGPFRDAVGSAAALRAAEAAPAMSPQRGAPGDRKQAIAGASLKATYQMDPRNGDEALREIALDIAEGADMVMVKPGLPYLDIISRASREFHVPVFAYQVSGEYAMIKAAAQNGWLGGDAVMLESLLALKRAGARAIFTYAALEVAEKL